MRLDITQKLANRAAVHAIGAALLAAGAAAFYQGFYAPLRDDVAHRIHRIEEVRGLSSHRPEIAAQHARAVQRLNELTRAAGDARKRMPSVISASDFTENLARLAAENDVDIEQPTANPPQFYDRHATIDVTCRLAGSYASICQYLAAINQLPQISRIWQFDLTRTSDSDGYPTQVTFQLYYQLVPNDKDQQRGTL